MIAGMARRLFIIGLITMVLFIKTTSSSTLVQQLKKVIMDNQANRIKKYPFTTCPGVVFAVDESFNQDTIKEFIDNFAYATPILVLESDNISSIVLDSSERENVCYHLVQFISDLQQFENVYNKLKEVVYLKLKILIMPEFIETEDVEQLLKSKQSEDLILIAINNGLMPNHFQVYQWRIDGKVHYSSDIIEVSSISNLMGRKLRIGTLHFPPAVFITNNTNNTSSVYGVEASLINLLSSSLNFSIDYVFSSPNEMWGNIITQEDGKVEGYGLRGMLYRKEIDVAFGELYFYDKMNKYFSFSEAFKSNHECFLIPSPKPYPRWMAVIFPFALLTWIATLFSLIFAVVTLNLVARWTKNNNRDSYFEDGILSCLYITGNLLNVSQPRGIHSMKNRLFMVAWLFAAAILSSAYCSGLISFLTEPSSPKPIQTIEQLVKSSLNKATFFKFTINSIINSTDPYIRLLSQQLIPTSNITYMFSLLDSGEWAVPSSIDRLLYEAVLRYPDNKHEDPPYYLMKECILPTRSSFGLQKISPLKPYFDTKILRFVETGLVKYHRSQFVKELRHLQRQNNSKEMTPFSLNNLQGAFYLFIFGVILSIVVFILELFIHRIMKMLTYI